MLLEAGTEFLLEPALDIIIQFFPKDINKLIPLEPPQDQINNLKNPRTVLNSRQYNLLTLQALKHRICKIRIPQNNLHLDHPLMQVISIKGDTFSSVHQNLRYCSIAAVGLFLWYFGFVEEVFEEVVDEGVDV